MAAGLGLDFFEEGGVAEWGSGVGTAAEELFCFGIGGDADEVAPGGYAAEVGVEIHVEDFSIGEVRALGVGGGA